MLSNKIYRYLENYTLESGRQLVWFGMIMFINFPLYYIVWRSVTPFSAENFYLRLVGSLICLPLIFKKYWPTAIEKYLPIYWFIAVLYCLPFFFAYMTLKNNMNVTWLMNDISVLFFLLILFDLKSFAFLSAVGILIAYVNFVFLHHQHVIFDPGTTNASAVLFTYLASFIIGAIFARNRTAIATEKFKTMQMISASIAHELRTPLSTVALNVETIDENLPILIKNNEMLASQETLSPRKVNYLQQALSSIKNEVKASLLFIEMLLVNLRPVKLGNACEIYSIKAIVEEAIERYPFQSHERDKVQLDLAVDFHIKGEKVFLIHLFFNLIKNALYAIAAVSHEAGMIQIKTSSNGQHILSFKDTGTGISKSALKHIFDKFYSDKRHGSGIGLAYCKMIMAQLGGKMKVRSKLGEFTEFYLIFPKLKDES